MRRSRQVTDRSRYRSDPEQEHEGAHLLVVTRPDDLLDLAVLVSRAARFQDGDEAYRTELDAWDATPTFRCGTSRSNMKARCRSRSGWTTGRPQMVLRVGWPDRATGRRWPRRGVACPRYGVS
jgi:hypothetical protein